MTMTPKNSEKKLEQAKANLAKLETAESRQQQHLIDLEAETATLAKEHRAAATAAAIEGDSPPPAPMRLAQAQAELTTGRGVLEDLQSSLNDARQAVLDAQAADTVARRRAIVQPVETKAQKLWIEIAEKFTELVDLTGATGADAVSRLTDTVAPLWPEHDPILKALKAEELDIGEGGYLEVLPQDVLAMDYTDGIIERHNGEPRPDQGARARI